MRPARLVLTFLGLFLTTAAALALGSDHPKGPIPRGDKWPDGLVELVNRPDRVHGYWVNSVDIFFYAGNTKALNEFLEAYAKLPGTHLKLVLHPGVKKARSPWDKEDREIPTEWRLYCAPHSPRGIEGDGKFHTRIDVYLGGRVLLEDLRVPASVEVESGGEIEKFIEQHRKK
jgi:hypothetical protein